MLAKSLKSFDTHLMSGSVLTVLLIKWLKCYIPGFQGDFLEKKIHLCLKQRHVIYENTKYKEACVLLFPILGKQQLVP